MTSTAAMRDRAAADRKAGVHPYLVQQEGKRNCGEHLAKLADISGPLGDLGKESALEPGSKQTDHGDESERVARTHKDASKNSDADRRCDGESELTAEHQDRTDRDQRLGPHTIKQDSGGDLKTGIDHQLHHGETRQRRRRDIEAMSGLYAGDTKGGPLHHRNDVRENRDAPNKPGPPRIHLSTVARGTSPSGGAHTSEKTARCLRRCGGRRGSFRVPQRSRRPRAVRRQCR